MAKYTFSMESDDLHEVVAFLNAAEGKITLPANEAAEEAEEAPKPKATKAKATKAKEGNAPANSDTEATSAPASTPESESSTSDTGPTATSDASPSDEAPEITLQDIKDKASEIIAKDASAGPKVVEKLKSDFGAAAFGQVKPEDYARCFAMLEEF